ncbi:MAG: GSCFA domain-containing protein [Flavobacteriaceae bacterium]
MNLQTHLPLVPQEPQIDYGSKLVLLGSCFTENIGGKLDYFQFRNCQNPFGVIFNPVSLSNLVVRAVKNDFFTEEDVFEQQGLWHCFEVHSTLSQLQKEALLKQLNELLKAVKKDLSEASHIILTLGSAWVYRFKETQNMVANCHKVPQNQFSKELLSVEEIRNSLARLISEIQAINPKGTVIFTVSPVRHLKDGFVENNRSKAHLISALHELLANHPQYYYFPSYELMMDELRDYRFYATDLLHPNELAIDYLWEKFLAVWVSHTTEGLRKEIDSIQKRLQHKPHHPESEAHLAFQKKLQESIESVKQQLPFISLKIN